LKMRHRSEGASDPALKVGLGPQEAKNAVICPSCAPQAGPSGAGSGTLPSLLNRRKAAAQILKHSYAFDSLATRPQTKVLQTVSRQVFATVGNRKPHKHHRCVPLLNRWSLWAAIGSTDDRMLLTLALRPGTSFLENLMAFSSSLCCGNSPALTCTDPTRSQSRSSRWRVLASSSRRHPACL
jgi:hypothetical protein